MRGRAGPFEMAMSRRWRVEAKASGANGASTRSSKAWTQASRAPLMGIELVSTSRIEKNFDGLRRVQAGGCIKGGASPLPVVHRGTPREEELGGQMGRRQSPRGAKGQARLVPRGRFMRADEILPQCHRARRRRGA